MAALNEPISGARPSRSLPLSTISCDRSVMHLPGPDSTSSPSMIQTFSTGSRRLAPLTARGPAPGRACAPASVPLQPGRRPRRASQQSAARRQRRHSLPCTSPKQGQVSQIGHFVRSCRGLRGRKRSLYFTGDQRMESQAVLRKQIWA